MFNLTLSPSQVELLAKPDTTITQGFDIVNNSDSNIILNTSIRFWQPAGTSGLVSYSGITPQPYLEFSLANADKTLGQSFVLKSGEKQQLVLKIKTTANSPLSDSYFTFFISQDTSNALNPNQIGAETMAEIGSHILLSTSTSENLVAKASISNFIVAPKLKDVFLSRLTFSGLINNESDHFFKADGKITISKNGATLQELTLFPHNVLSNFSRQIDCLQDNEPVPCTLNPPLWPGAYTATIEANHASISLNFFVFPFFPIVVVGLAVLIYLLTRFIRNYIFK